MNCMETTQHPWEKAKNVISFHSFNMSAIYLKDEINGDEVQEDASAHLGWEAGSSAGSFWCLC